MPRDFTRSPGTRIRNGASTGSGRNRSFIGSTGTCILHSTGTTIYTSSGPTCSPATFILNGIGIGIGMAMTTGGSGHAHTP